MENKSFFTFYYTKDNKTHSIDEVQSEYEKKKDISCYKGYMFCPECQKAELSFTRKTYLKRAFLSKLPTSNHEEGCSYIHDYATKNEVKQFIDSLNSRQIQDRLETVINSLTRAKNDKNIKSNKSNTQNPFIIEVKNRNNNRTYKSIPRKSLNSSFKKEEQDNIYIFYGTVKLTAKEFVSKKGKTFYKLLIYIKRNNQWKYKTQIFRNNIQDDIDSNLEYYIAAFGNINFYNKKPQIRIETPTSIMFRIKK